MFALWLFPANSTSQWVLVNSGIQGSSVMCLTSNGNTLYVGTAFGGAVFKSTNLGENWSVVGLTSMNIYSLGYRNGLLMAGTYGNGLFTSTNGGVNWLSAVGISDNDIFSLGYDSTNLYAGTADSGMFLSYNNAQFWIPSNSGLRGKEVGDIHYFNGAVYAATWNGVFKTTTNGFSWIAQNSGLMDTNTLAISSSGNSLFVGANSGVYRSDNNGSSWFPIGSVKRPYAFASYGGNIFCASHDSGVYVSTNLGQTWIKKNEGFFNLSMIAIYAHNGYIFAGSTDGRVYRRPINEMISNIVQTSAFVSGYRLYQNYPNPFNPKSEIQFDVPKKVHVRLAAYNVQGKLVQLIINEQLIQGSYKVSFEADDLPSGTYFYNIRAGDFSETKRMVLLK